MQPLKHGCGFLVVVVAILLASLTGGPFNVAFANKIEAGTTITRIISTPFSVIGPI